MPNRRSDIRVRVTGKMDAVITYSDTLSHANSGTISDMSRKGIFLKTDSHFSKDAYISMKLGTDDIIGKSLWAQGFVVRVGKDGVGIRLTYIEQDIDKVLPH